MSRLGLYTLVALTGASLILPCGLASSATARDSCGQRYRSCNVSCNQSVDADYTVGLCKKRCDIQLIACDTAPPASLSQARGVSTPRLPSNDE